MKFVDVVLLCSALGVLDGAYLPHKYSTVLPSALPREIMERDNMRQWEYITPTSKYDGSSEADQVKVNSSRKSPLVSEVQMGSYSGSMLSESSILADVHLKEMDHVMRFVRPVGSNVVLPGFKPMNLESIQWSFLNYKTKKTIIQYSHFKFTINPFYRGRAEFNVTSGALLLRDLQLEDSGIYEVILNPKENKLFIKGDEISSIHLDVQGNLFIHEDALVGSVIVLVSTVTSFTASAFIVYALEKDQVKIYWLQVTSTILVFHGMSLFCQVIAFVIFNINTGKRSIFLGSETIAVLIACLPLMKSKQNRAVQII